MRRAPLGHLQDRGEFDRQRSSAEGAPSCCIVVLSVHGPQHGHRIGFAGWLLQPAHRSESSRGFYLPKLEAFEAPEYGLCRMFLAGSGRCTSLAIFAAEEDLQPCCPQGSHCEAADPDRDEVAF